MQATVRVQTDRVVARAPDLLRGLFMEHVHRCIDDGIYEEDSPLSDERGFRIDVLDHLRELRPSLLRYPGGNFACDYDWRQGVLPKEQRPRRFNYGTQEIASYRFGTHEFFEYCRELGAEPMLTINAGTGTPSMGADWVEYCNSAGDGEFARLRRANGFDEPWHVPYWFLGNEIYGDWVPGTMTGEAYARFAVEAAKLIKWVDPDVKLIGIATGTYLPDWDRASLESTVDIVDYVSLHMYVGRHNYYDCVGSPAVIEQGIRLVRGAIEAAANKKNLQQLPLISLDEYNVWYRTRHVPDAAEERYNLQDALTVAGIQHVLFRNAQTVGMACLALVCNTLGPIMTNADGSFRQTIYWPLKFVADYFGRDVVDCFVRCPTFTCRHPKTFAGIVEVDAAGQDIDNQATRELMAEFPDLPYLDVCTTVDQAARKLILSVINRHETETMETSVQIIGDRVLGTATGHLLTAPSVKTENSFENPDAVVPVPVQEFSVANDFTYSFPAHSHTVLSVALQ